MASIMNMGALNMEELQMLAMAAATASAAAQHGSRMATPPVTPSATPKASASSTRVPTPTQNGIPQLVRDYTCIGEIAGFVIYITVAFFKCTISTFLMPFICSFPLML
jgi:hypothetical protein